jgi:hypothetical protein
MIGRMNSSQTVANGPEGSPQVPRSSGPTSRVMKAAQAKYEGFAITASDITIGVIEGTLAWSAAHRGAGEHEGPPAPIRGCSAPGG